jgi:hypothetical protein
MSNIFSRITKQRKTYFIVCIIFEVFILSGAINLLKVKENTANFIIFYVVIPIAFSLVYLYVERIIKKRKRLQNLI